jgi:stalled ribosome alternative rescue factor ArfA
VNEEAMAHWRKGGGCYAKENNNNNNDNNNNVTEKVVPVLIGANGTTSKSLR